MNKTFGLLVRFELRPGAGEKFDQLTAEIMNSILENEPETLIYIAQPLEQDPNARIFYELYRNHQAFLFHESQLYVKHFLREREKFLTSTKVDYLASPIKAISRELLNGDKRL